MPSRKEILEIAGREVTISNPEKVFFPQTGHTKLDLGPLLRGRRRRRPAGRGEPTDGAEAVRERRRGGVLLPEASAVLATRVDRDGRAQLPVGADGPRDRHPRRGAARVGREPRLHRPQPSSGPRRRPRPPRRAARGPRPGAGRRVGADPRRRHGGEAGPVGLRARRMAEDVRLARDPRQRPDRAPLDASRRSAGRPSRWRATWSAGRQISPRASGGRRSVTASSSTTTRTRKIERSPPHTRSAPRPTPGSRPRFGGMRFPTANPRRSRSRPFPSGSRASAIPRKGSTEPRGRYRTY